MQEQEQPSRFGSPSRRNSLAMASSWWAAASGEGVRRLLDELIVALADLSRPVIEIDGPATVARFM